MFAPLSAPLAAQPALLNLLRLATAFVLLLVPAAAMGMTLPLLARAASAWDANFGRVLGLLYGANTLGAVLGALATETVLLERFGIRGSALCAGALNLAAAGAALVLARGARAQAQARSAPDQPAPADAPARACAVARGWILGGFTLLALEVIWLRFLSLFLNDTPLAFAVVLALVLAGISLGGLLASVWASVSERAAERAWLVAYAAGLLGLAGYVIYPRFLQGALSAYPQAPEIAAIAAPLVMPTSLASGALFALSAAGLRKVVGSVAETAGSFSFANTWAPDSDR